MPEQKKILKPQAVKKQADMRKPNKSNKLKPDLPKKEQPVKKAVFNTAMADALSKLKQETG